MLVNGQGPLGAKVVVVGEYPGTEELARGIPFCGASGHLLKTMLREAGFDPEQIYFTNVLNDGPPPKRKASDRFPDFNAFFRGKDGVDPRLLAAKDRLRSEINRIKPNLIIACGGGALWTLTGLSGVMKWAGSQLRSTADFGGSKLIPTYNPAFILRSYGEKFAMAKDLRRAAREARSFNYKLPSHKYILEPRFEQVKELLHTWHLLYDDWSIDIETAKGQIECVGIAVTKDLALCIPFMDPRKADWCYWSFEQEQEIRALLRFYMTHPRRQIIGQNFDYDTQYFIVRMGFQPKVRWDTMIMSHVLYCELPKSLDYLARLWAEQYVYWKDDGKIVDFSVPPRQRWEYNCRDCCYTIEIAEQLRYQLTQQNMMEVYLWRTQELLPEVVKVMLRGIRVDRQAQAAFAVECEAAYARMASELEVVLSHPLNPNSNKQMKALFLDDFACQPVLDRVTGNPTFDDEALVTLEKKYPLLRPVIRRIRNMRTATTYRSNYGPPREKIGKAKAIEGMRLDEDSRARTQYKIAGPVTFRFASTKNVFGSGRNLQNIPRDEDDIEPWQFVPPSVKHMFYADPGYTLCEFDLERADIKVVVELLDDDRMRKMMAEGKDIYVENAKIVTRRETISDSLRSKYKQLINGTHYGGAPYGISSRIGLSVNECQSFQQGYFRLVPVKAWHSRTDTKLTTTRRVDNPFGLRRIFFDRIEGKLGEALAWEPQSVVGEVINRAWVQLARVVPEVEVLLQVHDSILTQIRTDRLGELRPRIREAMRVTVPYAKPFEIGVGLAISPASWGDAQKKWKVGDRSYNGWDVPLELALGAKLAA